MMKILLSAYACEPHKGSEPGIGWHWAQTLGQQGHEVWVLTRAANRQAIRDETARGGGHKDIRFIYLDLSERLLQWKRIRGGIYLYYLLWQVRAARRAFALHADVGFDIVHHVTFSGFRQPSFMGLLGIPFILGPLAGGETAPRRLRRGYGVRGRLSDLARDVSNALVRIDPLMLLTFMTAARIWASTPQTLAAIPGPFRSRAAVALSIGVPGMPLSAGAAGTETNRTGPGRGLNILYAGELVYWKGMHLGLRAFSKLAAQRPDARLTLVGDGPDKGRWQRLARKLRLEGKVVWTGRLPQEVLFDRLPGFDLFLFPSLHDSGGMAVLEAMAAGVPVICLDLGGPGVMVNCTCGRKIPARGRSREAVVDALARAMSELAADRDLREKLGRGAQKRARELTWTRLARSVYGEFDTWACGAATMAEPCAGYPGRQKRNSDLAMKSPQ